MSSPTPDAWTQVSSTYQIHPETVEHTRRIRDAGLKPSRDISLEENIAQNLEFSLAANGDYNFRGLQKDVAIPCSNTAEGIPISVYKPDTAPTCPAIMIYFHGGSLLMGSRKTHERSLQTIAEKSGAIVVNVEYRLLPCPEDPFAPFNDAEEAVQWVLKNKEAVGGSSDSKVGISGDSAGGQIACSLPETVSGLDFQVLVYPTVTDLSTRLPSSEEFYATPVLNTQALEWRFGITNAPVPDATNNPRVHSLCRTNFEGMPRTLIVLAQLDPLRDYGVAYAQKLKDAGIEIEEAIIEGVPHGFFSLPGIYKVKCDEAFTAITEFLKPFHG